MYNFLLLIILFESYTMLILLSKLVLYIQDYELMWTPARYNFYNNLFTLA